MWALWLWAVISVGMIAFWPLAWSFTSQIQFCCVAQKLFLSILSPNIYVVIAIRNGKSKNSNLLPLFAGLIASSKIFGYIISELISKNWNWVLRGGWWCFSDCGTLQRPPLPNVTNSLKPLKTDVVFKAQGQGFSDRVYLNYLLMNWTHLPPSQDNDEKQTTTTKVSVMITKLLLNYIVSSKKKQMLNEVCWLWGHLMGCVLYRT